jgi:dephospho-CoA kinase
LITIGLTGSIGMGKTTTADLFAKEGALIYDADAEVRRLYEPGGPAVAPIEQAFPGVTDERGVVRALLAERVLNDPESIKRLNAIVWPLMSDARNAFLKAARDAGASVAVLDIPLLLESGGDSLVDVVVVVTAPRRIQRRRVLEREGMTPEKFASITAAQMPDRLKRRRADYVIDTSHGLAAARLSVKDILRALRENAKQAN